MIREYIYFVDDNPNGTSGMTEEEIIRCRECKYCELNFIWSCKYHNGAIKLDDFCSFAERKAEQ